MKFEKIYPPQEKGQDAPKAEEQVIKKEVPVPFADEPDVKPTILISDKDSYIHERIKSQPSSLEELTGIRVRTEIPGVHGLSLPDWFEAFSHDCTRGDSCTIHKKDKRGAVQNPGKFVFRWVSKNKRSIDEHLDLKEWAIVNRTRLFRDAPKELFTANGAFERGDSLLMVMPFDRARFIREFPHKKSMDRIRNQISRSKTKTGRFVMTGNPENSDFYEPDMSAEESESAIPSTENTAE